MDATEIAYLAMVVSGLAGVGSILVGWRQSRIGHQQEQTDAELKAVQLELARAQLADIQQDRAAPLARGMAKPVEPVARAEIVARVRPHRQRYTFWLDLINAGEADAFDVSARAEPAADGRESPWMSGEFESKLPAQRLRPGERVSIMGGMTMGTPSQYTVTVSWRDESGERTEVYAIDILASIT